MNQELKDLYQDIILQHSKHPQHFGKREDAQHVVEAYNPLCGDKFKLYLDLEGDQVSSFDFHGYGCAISKASSSMLAELSQNQRVEELIPVLERFVASLKSQEADWDAELPERLKVYEAAKAFPSRLQCATLSWEHLLNFLKSQEHSS